jgi:hypothetical protein
MQHNIKLAIYDADAGREIHSIKPMDNWLKKLDAIHQLMQYAKDNSIQGWINEYDLNWSNTQCANKHEL